MPLGRGVRRIGTNCNYVGVISMTELQGTWTSDRIDRCAALLRLKLSQIDRPERFEEGDIRRCLSGMKTISEHQTSLLFRAINPGDC
jgi:hypothetical protein